MINQRGSVLQIVLIVFMILNVIILSMSRKVIENARSLHDIEIVNQSRLIEIQFLYHLKQEAKNASLSTNTIEIEETEVHYEVEQVEYIYHVNVIFMSDTPYNIQLVIDRTTLTITSFSYQ
jgi:competence protein ComGC